MAKQLNNKRFHGVRTALLCLPLCCFSPLEQLLADHPVSVTVTSVYVSEELATVKMQVFLEDLYLFHALKPDDPEFLDHELLQQGIELHERFILERFAIRDMAGEAVRGRVVAVQDDAVPPDGVPLSDLMAHQITFELEYDLASLPEFLTFSQQFTDDEGMLPSEMKLIVKQANSTESVTAVLRPDDLETVRFDWNLPPLSAEASAAERESWAEQQKEETLGITSYSSVYSFLYIEDFEVRHEILIPLLTLEQSVLIARDDDEFLNIPEQDAARQQIEAYFQSGNPIEIDGVVISGEVQRCDFYGLNFRDFAMQAERREVPIITARVGIILAYPCDQAPQSVRLTWNRFNSFVWTISTVVYAFDEVVRTSLSRLGNKNQFCWQGPKRTIDPTPRPIPVQIESTRWTLTLPVLSVVAATVGLVVVATMLFFQVRRRVYVPTLAIFLLVALLARPYAQRTVGSHLGGRPKVLPEQAEAIFTHLLGHLYRAFDYRRESEIYDVLAISTSGDLLHDVYLQVRKGLMMAEQGGAVARVKDVSIVNGAMEELQGDRQLEGPAFAYRCRWNVAGTVEHWGHIHQRTNQYEAVFRVEDIGGNWKVTNLELIDERRLQFETRLRGL